MKKTAPFFIAAILLLSGGLMWWWSKQRNFIPVQTATSSSVSEQAMGTPYASLTQTDVAQAYEQRKKFETDIKAFLKNSGAMGATDRVVMLAKLQTQLEQYEYSKQLSAAEAYTLKTALIKATVDDEADQADALTELAERYRQQAEQREVQWVEEQQNNPQFQAYKSRESEVTNEVMAMQTIPNGLSREEYLRLRLQEEREKAYR